MALLLGIDLGTTATKAVLLDSDRDVLVEGSRSVRLWADRPGFAEVDVEDWHRNIAELVEDVSGQLGGAAEEIAAVAVTGMVPAVLPVNRHGAPLRRAILQNDARATVEITELDELFADLDLLETTGSALTQQSVAPTTLWLARHEPAVWDSTELIMGSYDWGAFALGALPSLERNWAIESGLFTLDGTVLPEVLEPARLRPSQLPPIRSTGDILGSVSLQAERWCGLRAGTPIVEGGADHVLAAWSSGLSEDGDWLVKLGGGGDILAVSEKPVIDRRLYLDAHVVDGLWLPNGCMATSGTLVRWFSELVGEPDLARLDLEAAGTSTGALICLPYLLGEKSPWHDPDLRGAFLGLGLDSSRGQLFRAVLESVAFGFRQHRDIMAELGLRLRPAARISDGGSRSALWTQIHADVLDITLEPVRGRTGAALGAALAAGIGIGALDSNDALRHLQLGPPVEPDPRAAEHYNELYSDWLAAGTAVAPLSHRTAERSRRWTA
jgi:xylulokinase